MDKVVFESVSKVFRHRPALFNWMGRERKGDTLALHDLSLSVQQGEVLVLLGPNGSGKTTTLKLVSTMLLPNAGRVLVGGADTRTQAGQVRKQVGFAVASERSFFPRLTCRENLEFFAALDEVPRRWRAQRVSQVMGQTGLLEAADTLVMKFSSGMYQRLGIARALVKSPSVILMDEPTRSLDPGSAAHFWDLTRELAEGGCTILLATHDLNEAVAVGDTMAVLCQGRLSTCRRITNHTRVDELRAFYFETAGEPEEAPELASRGAD
jgi:ABC-2 type transport system ATP-binding protein